MELNGAHAVKAVESGAAGEQHQMKTLNREQQMKTEKKQCAFPFPSFAKLVNCKTSIQNIKCRKWENEKADCDGGEERKRRIENPTVD